MISKIKIIFNFIKRISISTFLKLNNQKTGLGLILPYKGTKINIHKSAFIKINKGQFKINNKWDDNEPFGSVFSMRKKSKLIVDNSFQIYSNTRIIIHKNAILELGSGYINNNSTLNCYNSIKIGNDVFISENVSIRDSDNHSIISSPSHKISDPIVIGNNVWIGMNVTILKGVTIGDGSIIGAGTVLTKSIPANSLAVGVPGKVIKRDVHWK